MAVAGIVTNRVAQALDILGIRYMIVGSLSSAAHGMHRATADADFVAELKPGDGRRLEAELGSDFYCDAEFAEEGIRRGASISLIYKPQIFKIDIFVLGSSAYARAAFERRMRGTIEPDSEVQLYVQAPEDTLLSKLKWYRLGGEVSDQQWRDIIGVLQVQGGRLDEEYLKRWAVHEKVDDLLEKARRDAVI